MINFKKVMTTALIGGLFLSNINALEIKSGYIKYGLDWTGLTTSEKDYSYLGTNSKGISRSAVFNTGYFNVMNPLHTDLFNLTLGQTMWQDGDKSFNLYASASKSENAMFYASFTNTLGFNETLWVGEREYQESTIAMMDYTYLNLAGKGAGIENMKIMDLGSLSVAVLQDKKQENQISAENNNIDVRFTTNTLGSVGTLEAGLTYGTARAVKIDGVKPKEVSDEYLKDATTQGVLLSLALNTENTDMNLTNKLVAMYGKNMDGSLYSVDFDRIYQQSDVGENYFALINFGEIALASNITLDYALGYKANINDKAAKSKEDGYIGNNGSNHTFFVGVRPAYKWNDLHTTLLELGFSYNNDYFEDLDQDSGDKLSDTTTTTTHLKASLAQQVNIPQLKSKELGNAAIRLYATTGLYSKTRERAKVENTSSVGAAAVGVQFEWRK